ncbi:UDP-glycosyltransferase 86A2, partial [Cucurbita argyrosperma subsp. argyrosperma]
MALQSDHHNQNPHAIFIPYPLQGHVIPSVHLATHLAARGFTLTFINTHAIHHQTSTAHSTPLDDLFSGVRNSGLDIRYTTVSDGLPLGFDRSLNHDQFMGSLLHVFSAHVEEEVEKIVKTASSGGAAPVSCLIADTFFVWPSKVAKKFNLLYTDTTSVCHQIIFAAFHDVKAADFVLCNTVQELENDTVSALQAQIPFYAIGPIFPRGFTKSSVATSLWPESDCTHWLNTKPHGSVLYVSFGSYAHVSKTDLAEIAHGLSLSGVHFIWVIRPDITLEDAVKPNGSSDKAMNRFINHLNAAVSNKCGRRNTRARGF